MKPIKFSELSVDYLFFGLGLLICIAVLGFSNFSTDYLVGDESYLHLRLLGSGDYDPLSYGGRSVDYPTGFGIVLRWFTFLFEPVLAAKVLHFTLGILSFTLFFFILRKLTLLVEEKRLALFFLVFSPTFIYLFSFSGSFSLAIFLALGSFLLLLYEHNALATFLILLISYVNVYAVFFNLILLFIYAVWNKKSVKWATLTFLLSIFFTMYLYGLELGYREPVYLSELISDFGGEYGIAFFSLILSFFGFMVIWKRPYSKFFTYGMFTLLYLLLFFYSWILFYFIFFLSLLAALGLYEFITRRWESTLIKHFSLLLLILGVLFSGISYLERVDELGPTAKMINAFSVLEEFPKYQESTIFSQVSRGNWVSYFTHHKNFADTNYLNAPYSYTRLDDHNTLLFSGNENEVRDLTVDYNIQYIFLDGEVLNILLESGRSGILEVLDADPTLYTLLYEGDDVQLWRVNP